MPTFPFPAGARGTTPAEFATLRETAPVAQVKLTDGSFIWLVTRYADVVTVLTDTRFSRARAAELPGSGFGRSQRTGVLDLDPPEHTALRTPLDRALRHERVRSWMPKLARAVDEQLTKFTRREQPADLVAGFTAPLAARTTCELIGLDARISGQVAEWVDGVLPTGNQPGTMAWARAELDRLLSELVARRRATSADDIASTLLGDGTPSRGLDDEEALTVLFGLLVSGYVGNRNALARHIFALLSTPGSLGDLRADPVVAVEELLRYYPSSNDGLVRVTIEEVELAGVCLAAGEVVMPLIAAASHDPAVFDEPEQLNLLRRANHHVSFGRGTHACPGAHLVRALFQVVLSRMADTLPRLRLAVPADEVEHTSDLLPLGLRSLQVHW